MSKFKDQLTLEQEAERLRIQRTNQDRRARALIFTEINKSATVLEARTSAKVEAVQGGDIVHPGPIAMYNLPRGKQCKNTKK
jgi:hypothetical protein